MKGRLGARSYGEASASFTAAVTSRVSTCIPSGTRQASTQTVYVFVRVAPAPIGVGSGADDSMVAQSAPSPPMTCVANVTVPARAGDPPVLVNSTVTFSHQRSSAAARCGAPTVSTGGPGGTEGPGDDGPEGSPPGPPAPPEPPAPPPALWAPAVPAVLLSTYIVHLRTQERRRFAFAMDRQRAEAAARQLRENRPRRQQPAEAAPAGSDEEPEARHPDPEPVPAVSPQEAGRRALVEQTDHAEWVDQQRQRGPAQGDSWEPVPVPLPTYVTAPVAPRATGGVEVGDPETWSAARSSAAEPSRTGTSHPATPPPDPAPRPRTHQPRRTRDRGRTPLFDQYEDADRPRAANE